MPTIHGQLSSDGRNFLIVPVQVLPADSPISAPVDTTALIDTGSNVTIISSRLGDKLGLQRIDKGPDITTTAGFIKSYRHFLYIAFPFGDMMEGVPGPTYVAELVKDGDQPEPEFDVHLGMDVISTGMLIVDGATKTFSFRF
jgi:hypothetical protein